MGLFSGMAGQILLRLHNEEPEGSCDRDKEEGKVRVKDEEVPEAAEPVPAGRPGSASAPTAARRSPTSAASPATNSNAPNAAP